MIQMRNPDAPLDTAATSKEDPMKRIRNTAARSRSQATPRPPTPPPIPTNPSFTVLIAYLAYLITSRPVPSPTPSTLRLLILVVGVVLSVMAVIVAGRPDLVPQLVGGWALKP